MESGRPTAEVLERADLSANEQLVARLDPGLGAHVASFGTLTAVVVPGIVSPFLNRIYGLDAGRSRPFGDLYDAVTHYETRGITDFGVLVPEGGSHPGRLEAELSRQGFEPVARSTKLWRSLGDADATNSVLAAVSAPGRRPFLPLDVGSLGDADATDPPGGVVVERSVDADEVADLLVAGYGPDVAPRWWFAAPVGAPGWSHLVARLDGKPVGAAALHVDGAVGWLGFAATVARRAARASNAPSSTSAYASPRRPVVWSRWPRPLRRWSPDPTNRIATWPLWDSASPTTGRPGPRRHRRPPPMSSGLTSRLIPCDVAACGRRPRPPLDKNVCQGDSGRHARRRGDRGSVGRRRRARSDAGPAAGRAR